MANQKRYPKEFKERAVRLVFENEKDFKSQWAAIESVALKLGCTNETLRRWLRQAEINQGQREGLTTEEREEIKLLKKENRELKRANEILRLASAYFAKAELDRQ
jgi:transposase